ncbi:MAG: type VI secretion system tip protein TssI/VgrG, partial [Paracoccaceae bacterium]
MFEDRQISVKTLLADEDLMFAQMTGFDEISRCFSFDLSMLSEDMDIKAEDLLGQPITVRIGKDERERFIHGLVAEFSLEDITDGFAHYTANLRPWLWFLCKTSDNRIFQNLSVIEIIEEIFGTYPAAKFEKRLQETYDPREYCVQYGESDLHFVQRLMEHEGIFYFFDYADGEHTLVLTDTVSKLEPNPNLDEIKFQPDKLVTFQEGDYITHWRRKATVQSGAACHTDYDFTKPAADLMSKSENLLGHELDDGEAYHYPGNHTKLDRGDILSAIRIEELQSPAQRVFA